MCFVRPARAVCCLLSAGYVAASSPLRLGSIRLDWIRFGSAREQFAGVRMSFCAPLASAQIALLLLSPLLRLMMRPLCRCTQRARKGKGTSESERNRLAAVLCAGEKHVGRLGGEGSVRGCAAVHSTHTHSFRLRADQLICERSAVRLEKFAASWS